MLEGRTKEGQRKWKRRREKNNDETGKAGREGHCFPFEESVSRHVYPPKGESTERKTCLFLNLIKRPPCLSLSCRSEGGKQREKGRGEARLPVSRGNKVQVKQQTNTEHVKMGRAQRKKLKDKMFWTHYVVCVR